MRRNSKPRLRLPQIRKPAKFPKAKLNLGWTLTVIAKEQGLDLNTEVVFAPPRRWRFDWTLTGEGLLIAVEYEGIYLANQQTGASGHTTRAGYSANCEKYNAAAIRGWSLLRYTAKTAAAADTELRTLISHLKQYF